MPLSFPDYEDIRLARAPLREVICQVKFPRQLRISEQKPVAFQERIKQRFPVLQVERKMVLKLQGPEVDSVEPVAPTSVYRFYDRGRERQATLASEFFAVSTTAYKDWPAFAENLSCVADAVEAVYGIPFATRIGLRYINRLDATFTESGKFEDVYDLLRMELTQILRTGVMESLDYARHRIRVSDGEERFTFQYGLVRQGEPPEPVFLLDFDRFIEGDIGLDDVMCRCKDYHQVIYSAFRWCIAEDKLEVFQPLPRQKRGT